MLPLDQLLHRIKWDAEFGKAEFALGYYDRVLDEETIVPFASVTLDAQRDDTFRLTDQEGIERHIPMHRVRTVYRNGAPIWRRPPHPPPGRPPS